MNVMKNAQNDILYLIGKPSSTVYKDFLVVPLFPTFGPSGKIKKTIIHNVNVFRQNFFQIQPCSLMACPQEGSRLIKTYCTTQALGTLTSTIVFVRKPVKSFYSTYFIFGSSETNGRASVSNNGCDVCLMVEIFTNESFVNFSLQKKSFRSSLHYVVETVLQSRDLNENTCCRVNEWIYILNKLKPGFTKLLKMVSDKNISKLSVAPILLKF